MELTEQRRQQFIDKIAAAVVERRLEVPMTMALSVFYPLSFVAGQALIVSAPFLAAFIGINRINEFAAFLGERDNLELLIGRIETLGRERKMA